MGQQQRKMRRRGTSRGRAHRSRSAPRLVRSRARLTGAALRLVGFGARRCAELRASSLLSFLIVGGGPTGVETAAAIAELARSVLDRDYHWARANDVRVLVRERGPRVLPSFRPELAEHALARLGALGVHVRTQANVDSAEPWGVRLCSGERPRTRPPFAYVDKGHIHEHARPWPSDRTVLAQAAGGGRRLVGMAARPHPLPRRFRQPRASTADVGCGLHRVRSRRARDHRREGVPLTAAASEALQA